MDKINWDEIYTTCYNCGCMIDRMQGSLCDSCRREEAEGE